MRYRLPAGWLGLAGAGWKVARDVTQIFDYRAEKIDARFGGDFVRDFAPALERLHSFEDDGLVRLGAGGDVDVTPLRPLHSSRSPEPAAYS